MNCVFLARSIILKSLHRIDVCVFNFFLSEWSNIFCRYEPLYTKSVLERWNLRQERHILQLFMSFGIFRKKLFESYVHVMYSSRPQVEWALRDALYVIIIVIFNIQERMKLRDCSLKENTCNFFYIP